MKSKVTLKDLILEYKITKNDKTFGKIIKNTKPGLKFFIGRYLRDYDEVEEMISQTYVRVWENFDKYDENLYFNTWLYTIAKNECLSYLNFRNKHTCLSLMDNSNKDKEDGSCNFDKMLKDNNLSCEINYNLELCGKELSGTLYDLCLSYMKDLESPYKECIFMNLIKGISTLEISKEYDISENTIKTWVRKGKKDLKNMMQENHTDLLEIYNEEKG